MGMSISREVTKRTKALSLNPQQIAGFYLYLIKITFPVLPQTLVFPSFLPPKPIFSDSHGMAQLNLSFP